MEHKGRYCNLLEYMAISEIGNLSCLLIIAIHVIHILSGSELLRRSSIGFTSPEEWPRSS
jgi:hypothetical protein